MFTRNLSGSHSARPKKKVTFRYDFEEPTDSEFHDRYIKLISSPWFAANFVLCLFPFFWLELFRCTNFGTLDVQITCLQPELMNKMQWNASAVRLLTMPDLGRVCTYIDYNYSIFHRMDPDEAFIMKSQIDKELKHRGETLAVKKCSREINPGEYDLANYTRNFLMSCPGISYKRIALSLGTILDCAGCLIMGILCDLIGRKPVFIIYLVIYISGIMLQPFVDTYQKLVSSYALQSFASLGMVFSSYILFLELCGSKSRSVMGLYIFITCPLGSLTCLATKGFIQDLRAVTYLYSLPVALPLFLAYFLPESPRWLLSYGKKLRAWKILEQWGEDVSLEHFLPALQQNPFKIVHENLKILLLSHKYRKTILIMAYYHFVQRVLTLNGRRYVKVKQISATSHKYLVFMSELFSFLCIMPPFILCGRYVTLAYQLACATICLVVSLFVEKGDGWYILNLLCTQYLYGVEYISYLYSCELLPTAMRGTGLGIILCVGRGLTAMLQYIINLTLSQTKALAAERFFFLVFLVIGNFLIPLLPNKRVIELPDWKRYRNVIPT